MSYAAAARATEAAIDQVKCAVIDDLSEKFSARFAGLEAQNVEMGNTLSKIDGAVEDMKHRLFGNGQPGELEKQEGRIHNLELFKATHEGGRINWMAIGVVASALLSLGGLLIAAIKH